MTDTVAVDISSNKNNFTIEQLKQAVPAKLKTCVSQELVDKLNNVSNDPEISKEIQENFITYSLVLREGRYRIDDYFNAVTYCTYKIMGMTNKDAYIKTFPVRYQTLLAKGTFDKDFSCYVTAYHKTKLVQSILEKTIIPFHILNQDARQEALNVQVKLMMTAKSEMVRMKAAESVLAHTEAPTANGPLLNVNINKTSAMEDLEKAMSDLARIQQNALKDGILTLQDLAAQKVVDAELIESNNENDLEDNPDEY